MRKLILLMQVSLDGFIEGPNGDMSWVKQNDDEQWNNLFEVLDSVDLFLLGRVMYPEYRKYWIDTLANSNAPKNELDYAKLADKSQHIVFSSTMKDAGWHNTKIVSGPVVEEVRKLKEQPGKNIQIVGGAKLAATLLNGGLVDELHLTVNPVILASGKSFFHQLTNKHTLELIQTKTLKSGIVILKYKKTANQVL